jgi:putative FmdB family regulatory protein
MPIYEYECPECGRFETIQKFSDKPLTQCPRCKEAGKKSSVKKAVSASAFHLKGSGWYKTDYSSGNSSSVAQKSESSSSSESKASSGADSTKSPSTKAPSGKACGSGCGCH